MKQGFNHYKVVSMMDFLPGKVHIRYPWNTVTKWLVNANSNTDHLPMQCHVYILKAGPYMNTSNWTLNTNRMLDNFYTNLWISLSVWWERGKNFEKQSEAHHFVDIIMCVYVICVFNVFALWTLGLFLLFVLASKHSN